MCERRITEPQNCTAKFYKKGIATGYFDFIVSDCGNPFLCRVLQYIFCGDTSTMVSMTEANQNFSKVARLVDEKGSAVIMKNNMPKYQEKLDTLVKAQKSKKE